MRGYVYILTNPSFNDSRIKIGRAIDPEARKLELDRTTSLPEPFRLEYVAHVKDCEDAEQALHRHFSDRRVNDRREFFDVPVPEAIVAAQELLEILHQEISYRSPEEIEIQRRAVEKKKIAAQLKAEAEEREHKKISDWLERVNQPILKRREEYIQTETSEINEQWWGGTTVIALFLIFGLDELGLGIALSLVLALICAFIVSGKKSDLNERASKQFPLQDEADYKRLRRSHLNADERVTASCPKCAALFWLPTGKTLKVKCPKCSHRWQTTT